MHMIVLLSYVLNLAHRIDTIIRIVVSWLSILAVVYYSIIGWLFNISKIYGGKMANITKTQTTGWTAAYNWNINSGFGFYFSNLNYLVGTSTYVVNGGTNNLKWLVENTSIQDIQIDNETIEDENGTVKIIHYWIKTMIIFNIWIWNFFIKKIS